MSDKNTQKIAVIGAGLAGLSAACYLAKAGYQVDVYEEMDKIGESSRLERLADFEFSLNRNWYFRPEIWERVSDDFGLPRLKFNKNKTCYRVFLEREEFDVESGRGAQELFSKLEPGAGIELDKLLQLARKDYSRQLKANNNSFQFSKNIGAGYHKLIKKFVHDERLIKLLEFKALFFGLSPKRAKTKLNFLNFIDFNLGLPQPETGVEGAVKLLEDIAQKQNVSIHLGEKVKNIKIVDGRIVSLKIDRKQIKVSAVIAENKVEVNELLSQEDGQAETKLRKTKSWPRRLVWAFILDQPANNLQDRNVFWDGDWDDYLKSTFKTNQWPDSPVFTVDKITLDNDERNCLVVTMVLSGQLAGNSEQEKRLENQILNRISNRLQFDIEKHIIESRRYELDSGSFKSEKPFTSFRSTDKLKPVKGLYLLNAKGTFATLEQQIILGKTISAQIKL